MKSKKSPFRFLIHILILLLQWTYRDSVVSSDAHLHVLLQWTCHDSVVSSDARLHVNPIHFLARRAVY